jgi:pimeloyl-ACP methyl ester carboxylesterase
MLAHETLTAPGAAPGQHLLFVHGILGARSNWRTVARLFVRERPEWGACLVDLRAHGDSRGPFESPHSMRAAADDIARLVRAQSLPVTGIVGHSFGGKVGLLWAEGARQVGQVWLIDSSPGADPTRAEGTETRRLLDRLRSVRFPVRSRNELSAELERAGVGGPTARRVGVSLVPRPSGGFDLPLPMDDVDRLLDGYYREDLWELLSRSDDRRHWLVLGGKSDVVRPPDRRRAAELARSARLNVVEIEDAGHWVQIDATRDLVKLLVEHV